MSSESAGGAKSAHPAAIADRGPAMTLLWLHRPRTGIIAVSVPFTNINGTAVFTGDNPQEPYTGPPVYKPGDPEYEEWIAGWGRREDSAREDPVPVRKPSRPSWVPRAGPCNRWIPAYSGEDYETFIPSGGGPALRKFGDGTIEIEGQTKEAEPPAGLDLPTSKKEEAKETEGDAKGEAVEPKEAKRPRKEI
eukprot:scaffold156622_cov49-Cyclotella_meneghiniana.AAC.3